MRWALGLFTPRPPAAGNAEIASGPTAQHPGISWGDLDRVSPVSDTWGLDRGRPIDRYYIEAFLEGHAADIQGTVFEMKDPGYTRRFGQERVTRAVVVDVDPENPLATLRADLAAPDQCPSSQADCFVLTQTVHIIYDHAASVRSAMQVLKPGGVLLCTIPAVSRVNYENGGLRNGDFWRMTRAAVERLFGDLDSASQLEIQTFGNVRTCAAFLYGLAAEDMPPPVLEFHDPWFPLIHCVRAVKRA
jgi:SAM-dependent methyltransferase